MRNCARDEKMSASRLRAIDVLSICGWGPGYSSHQEVSSRSQGGVRLENQPAGENTDSQIDLSPWPLGSRSCGDVTRPRSHASTLSRSPHFRCCTSSSRLSFLMHAHCANGEPQMLQNQKAFKHQCDATEENSTPTQGLIQWALPEMQAY